MADPLLKIFDAKGHVVFRNDNGCTGDVADIRAAFNTAQAFDLPDNSKDAVLWVSLEAGLYTARAASSSSPTSEVLIEAYDLQE